MTKPKIAIIRGAFLNPWEMQNFEPLQAKFDITVISSLKPLNDNINLPLVKLVSPVDIPDFPYKMKILNRVLTDAQWLFGLNNEIRDFDITHVAETYFAYTYQAIAAKKLGLIKKIVSTCWEIIPFNNEGIHGRKEWKKLAYKEIDHFICPTELAKKCLIEEGCSPDKISVIRMGVELDNYQYQISNDKTLKKILFIGRLEKEKGIWELISAFNKLSSKYNNIKLDIVGDGQELRRLRDFVLLKKLTKQVFFPGSISYNKIPNLLKNSDIFVLPSKATKTWQEQYGMVLVEAMASGLPIISTNSGAIPEVLGNAGILIKPGNISELSKALENLINKPSSKNTLSMKAIKRAEDEFDYNKTADRIGKLYQKILKTK